jgi:hypothetical protein
MIRMSRRAVLAAGFAPALPLNAEDPWIAKKPTEWSDQELVRILNDSPWALKVEIVAGSPALSQTYSGSDLVAYGKAPSIPFVVRWVSAAPIKEAYVRARMGKEAGSKEAADYLSRSEPHYAIAVLCPPRLNPPWDANDVKQRLKAETVLQRKGKPDLHPESVEIVESARRAIVFRFPRTGEITMADEDVQFATVLTLSWARIYIKRKFPLKDMAWQGKLAL